MISLIKLRGRKLVKSKRRNKKIIEVFSDRYFYIYRLLNGMFPNFGLVNQMTNHLANNGQPKILDYTNSSVNGYEYTPPRVDESGDMRNESDSVAQQKMFNEFANSLIYENDKYNSDLNMNNCKYNNIAALNERSPRYEFIQRSCHDNNRLYCPVVNNYNRAVEAFSRVNDTLNDRLYDNVPIAMYGNGRVGPDVLFQAKPYVRNAVVVALVMLFALLYIMLQMYISQKHVEMLLLNRILDKSKR